MQGVGEVLQRQGLDTNVVEFLLDSWRDGTKKQYGCYLAKWAKFCNANEVNCYDPSLNDVLAFLLSEFNRGLGYSTLNTVRSALSSMIKVDDRPVGQHPTVIKFMRTVYLRRPNLPRNNVIWDVNIVLEYLATIGPAKTIPLSMLTKKVVALMAILSGARGQTPYLLDVENMTIEPDSISFRVGEPTKTSRPGRHVSEIRFNAYPFMKRLCVVYYLKVYLKRTLETRWTVKQLLLSYGVTGRAAARATVRRWIYDVLVAAGIDMGIFTPHSTRSASTSAASSYVRLATILSTAGWANPSCFQKFYKKKVEKSCAFQESLLKRYRKR